MVLLRVSLPGEASELELELLLSASVPVEDESESSESESRLLLSVSASVEDESPDSESSVAGAGACWAGRGPEGRGRDEGMPASRLAACQVRLVAGCMAS